MGRKSKDAQENKEQVNENTGLSNEEAEASEPTSDEANELESEESMESDAPIETVEELPKGRVFIAGTVLRLAGEEVTLLADTVFGYKGHGSEQKFVGMLLNSHPQNMAVNLSRLRWKYDHNGALLPIEHQGLSREEIKGLSDADKELFGIK